MTTPTVHVADVDLPFIEYQRQPIVTFAMIDAAHQRATGTAKRNFRANKRHLVEDEDFYVVDSKSLDEIRPSYPGIFPKMATSMYFFTETGYLMLAKSLTDDLAWQVQRQLVKGYFRARNERPGPTTVAPIPEPISHEQRQQLRKAVEDLFNNPMMRSDGGGTQWLHNLLRVRFSLRRIEDLPAHHFGDVMAIVESRRQAVSDFLQLNMELRSSFYRDVIGEGEQWTPWLARQIGGTHKLPRQPDWSAIAREVLANNGLLPTRH